MYSGKKTKKFANWFNEVIEKKLEPEKVLEKFLEWFDFNKKLVFLITLIFGIITHISMFTGMIMSQDGLWNSMGYSRPGVFEMTLGRWGIEIMQRANFYIAIPTISTISCVLITAITAIFLVDLFNFKSKISVIITALILAVSPVLTVTLLYIYTAFAYCSNLLIATLIIWFIYKFKHKKLGLIIAILLFVLSLSIYQSYIGVSVGLCMMISILELLRNEKTIKETFINIGKTVITVFVGGMLYYIITTILLKINYLELATYKNINAFSIKDIFLNLGNTIPNCYKDFFNFFISNNIFYNTNYRREVFYVVLFAIFLITLISAILSIEKKRGIKAILVILFVALLPIGLNIINVIVVSNEIYALTAAQMILFIPFIFAILETVNKFTVIKWIAILSCFYIVCSYYVADNTSYTSLKMRYNQANAVAIRMMDKLERTEGYDRNLPICVVGIIGDNNYPQVGNIYQYTLGSVFTNPIFHGSYEGSIGTLYNFLKVYLGEDLKFCSAEIYEKIVRSEELAKLEDFPKEGCTAIIENTLVIKLSNYIPLPDGTLLFEEY